MVRASVVALLLAALEPSCGAPAEADLRRARAKVPQESHKGQGSILSMNTVLNRHLLARDSLNTRHCEDFSALELQALLRSLAPLAEPELLEVYEATADNRQQRQRPEHREALWSRLNRHVGSEEALHAPLRDGLCHQAVLAFVHHLTASTQAELADAGFTMPLLPMQGHAKPAAASARAADVFEEYAQSVSCTVCHQGSEPVKTEGPRWPLQFSAKAAAWTEAQNMTISGMWYYDWTNNRLGMELTGGPGNVFSMTQTWLADPAPEGEGDAEEVYGKGAERGVFYVFTKPFPLMPTSCLKFPFSGMTVVRPDAFGSDLIDNVTHDQEEVDGVLADHYSYVFDSGGACDGIFQMWFDVSTGLPMRDYGPNGCPTEGQAQTDWSDFDLSQPDLTFFTSLDYSTCKEQASSMAELEQKLIEHSMVQLQGKEAELKDVKGFVQSALRHASLGHGVPPTRHAQGPAALV